MTYKAIAQLIPTAQSLAILGSALPSKKKKKKKIVKTGVEIIVGTALMKETAGITGSL